MKNAQQKFDVLSRVAQAMGHRLFETQRRVGGDASGTVYVALDTSGEPMTVCSTLKDVERDMAWHIDHRVKNADHRRFELAIEAGSLSWEELFSVAGSGHPVWAEKAEQLRLGKALPGVRAAQPRVRL
jgi:hypothetical protein